MSHWLCLECWSFRFDLFINRITKKLVTASFFVTTESGGFSFVTQFYEMYRWKFFCPIGSHLDILKKNPTVKEARLIAIMTTPWVRTSSFEAWVKHQETKIAMGLTVVK